MNRAEAIKAMVDGHSVKYFGELSTRDLTLSFVKPIGKFLWSDGQVASQIPDGEYEIAKEPMEWEGSVKCIPRDYWGGQSSYPITVATVHIPERFLGKKVIVKIKEIVE